MNFLVMDIMNNVVQEIHVLIRKFARVFMALYFINYLSQHNKIDIILCVDYMPTTKVIISLLEQHMFMLFRLCQKIKL